MVWNTGSFHLLAIQMLTNKISKRIFFLITFFDGSYGSVSLNMFVCLVENNILPIDKMRIERWIDWVNNFKYKHVFVLKQFLSNEFKTLIYLWGEGNIWSSMNKNYLDLNSSWIRTNSLSPSDSWIRKLNFGQRKSSDWKYHISWMGGFFLISFGVTKKKSKQAERYLDIFRKILDVNKVDMITLLED